MPIERKENSSNKKVTNRTSSHISIKSLLHQQEKEKEKNTANNSSQNEPVKFEKLCLYWNQYAYILKENGMETFYNALIKQKPEFISETEYALEVENQIQVDYITPKLQEFISFLQSNLKNYQLNILVRQKEVVTEETKHLTGNEKYKIMATKNPSLHVLKSVFNLDIEL